MHNMYALISQKLIQLCTFLRTNDTTGPNWIRNLVLAPIDDAKVRQTLKTALLCAQQGTGNPIFRRPPDDNLRKDNLLSDRRQQATRVKLWL